MAAVKSVGNSGTTPRDLVNNEDVWLMLLVMSESVAMRMRELNMKCTVVEVSVRDSDLNGFVRQRKIETPTSSSLEIAQVAFDLFKSNYRWGKPLRGVGVRGASLVPADTRYSWASSAMQKREKKLERLDKAVGWRARTVRVYQRPAGADLHRLWVGGDQPEGRPHGASGGVL